MRHESLSRLTRLPSEIWVVLYFVTILGMMAVGYQTGIAQSRVSMAYEPGPVLRRVRAHRLARTPAAAAH